MHPPLIVDRKDPKWLLLELVFAILSSRRTHQEFSKQGIKPIKFTETAFKIALLSMFFSVDCSFVIQELENRRKLRRFMHIDEVPSIDAIYRFFSKWEEKQFISGVSGILSTSLIFLPQIMKSHNIPSSEVKLDIAILLL